MFLCNAYKDKRNEARKKILGSETMASKTLKKIQGDSNMTGTNCDLFTHN
jgi:hypothetical protein